MDFAKMIERTEEDDLNAERPEENAVPELLQADPKNVFQLDKFFSTLLLNHEKVAPLEKKIRHLYEPKSRFVRQISGESVPIESQKFFISKLFALFENQFNDISKANFVGQHAPLLLLLNDNDLLPHEYKIAKDQAFDNCFTNLQTAWQEWSNQNLSFSDDFVNFNVFTQTEMLQLFGSTEPTHHYLNELFLNYVMKYPKKNSKKKRSTLFKGSVLRKLRQVSLKATFYLLLISNVLDSEVLRELEEQLYLAANSNFSASRLP